MIMSFCMVLLFRAHRTYSRPGVLRKKTSAEGGGGGVNKHHHPARPALINTLTFAELRPCVRKDETSKNYAWLYSRKQSRNNHIKQYLTLGPEILSAAM